MKNTSKLQALRNRLSVYVASSLVYLETKLGVTEVVPAELNAEITAAVAGVLVWVISRTIQWLDDRNVVVDLEPTEDGLDFSWKSGRDQ